MISNIGPDHPLRKLFSGLVEQVFMTEIGICDPRLTDYISAMLGEFIHIDAIFQLHDVDGNQIKEISQAQADAFLGPEIDGSKRTRMINRYIGDFTLFWTGVYPESLRTRRVGVDRLNEYILMGRRSYGIAGELSDDKSRPTGALLRRLSEEFESCAHGLHLVRDGWRALGPDSSN